MLVVSSCCEDLGFAGRDHSVAINQLYGTKRDRGGENM